MNLREFCQSRTFSTAVLTTYTLDPLFFERVVLYDLVHGGATRIFVLADESEVFPAVTKARGQLVALGRQYRVIPVRMNGAFHPKVCVRIGRDQALVATGSHNLTRSGWLGRSSPEQAGGNRECTIAWRVTPGTPQAAELGKNLNELIRAVEFEDDRNELLGHLASTWLENAAKNIKDESGPAWGVFGIQNSLASVLETRWKGRRFERLRMVTGSTDHHAAMIRWAAATFGIHEAIIEVDRDCCSLDPKALTDLPVTLKVRIYDGNPRTHLKVAVFESGRDNAAVAGSCNCSAAAWLRTAKDGGNVESAVIYDHCGGSDLAHLFRSDQGEASDWRVADLTPPLEPMDAPPTKKWRLRRLQLHRTGGTLKATFDSSPQASADLYAVVGSSRVPLKPTREEKIWCGPLPDLLVGPETLFGHVEIGSNGQMELTNAVWIDDLDHLAAAAGQRLPFGSVGRLSAKAIPGDYKRMLEDLQVLSRVLLTQPSEFPDNTSAGHRTKTVSNTVDPARPVSVADVILSLDQLTSTRAEAHLSSFGNGTISLTGVMRILFGEAQDQIANMDPTDNEHTTTPPDVTADEGEGAPVTPASPEQAEPTPVQRKRLLEQLRHFKDELSTPRFATTCSARQLQQAAAYPLAVAQFAARGPWIESEDRASLAGIVREVCEVLFCRNIHQKDAKTGQHKIRPPLVEEVRARYAQQERATDFDQIIGDGTLWLVVMGSLAMMEENPEDRFARNLALCDVARLGLLSSNADSEKLAPLASRLWLNGSAGLPHRIKRLITAIDTLEGYLAAHCQEWHETAAAPALVADWLWNPSVAFAQVKELRDHGKAVIHVRTRCDDALVVLKYYVNLRQIGIQDCTLAALLSTCCE